MENSYQDKGSLARRSSTLGLTRSRLSRLLGAAGVLVGILTPLAALPAGSLTQSSSNTVVMAELPGASPNYIFPMDDCPHASVTNVQDFQQLMYRPLYWYGLGASTGIQYPLSLATAPRVSNHARTFTLEMKGWRFANGQVVNATSVKFYLDLLKADPYGDCSYTPGYGIPDQLSAVRAVGNQLTLTFATPQSLNFVLGNYLSQITPLPTAWSRTAKGKSALCVVGRYGAPNTNSSCTAVRDYLASLGSTTSTFANSFWRAGVDGPWLLQTLESSGSATFLANPNYSGRPKPQISGLREVAYTSVSSEMSDLSSNKLTVGYLDPSLLTPAMAKSRGANYAPLANTYSLVRVSPYAMGFAIVNFSSSAPNSALDHQLYIRQALQLGIDQPSLIQSAFNGFAQATYSPLPALTPPNVSKPIANPYSFNPLAGRALLTSHGWSPSGTELVCQRPGSESSECGPGVTQGQVLRLSITWVTGSASTTSMMTSEVAQWTKMGFTVSTKVDTPNNVVADCHNSATSDICVPGSGWTYTPSHFPSGEELFATQGAFNFGGYSDPTMNTLIHRSILFSGNLNAYASYAAQQLPVLFEPQPMSTIEVSKSLKSSVGFLQSPVASFTPEYLHF